MEVSSMQISNDIKYVGINDHKTDLFESQYIIPNGMALNSYVILDEKILVVDSVGGDFDDEWIANIKNVTGGREPDYFLVQHMEPDHSKNITTFMDTFKNARILASEKAFTFMNQFYHTTYPERRTVIMEGDTLSLGKHTLHFIQAQMVHWPEVMMTYDDYDKVLFAADGFGKFGANDVPDDDWACEARRYYFGIVGKYGRNVQAVLKKAKDLEIKTICSLHGPVLSGDLSYYINLYDIWSSYGVESEGIVINYTSVYGNTRAAVEKLAKRLEELGCPKVVVNDLARSDLAECVEDSFRYGKMVLATTTYMNDIFPFMKNLIYHLTERGYTNRTVGIIENGTWAPAAAKNILAMFGCAKGITFAENIVTIKSSLNEESEAQLEALAQELMK